MKRDGISWASEELGLFIVAGGKTQCVSADVGRREATVMTATPINACCWPLISFCHYPYL